MSTSGGTPLIVLEIVLGFAVPVAWGIWQLIELRRYREQDRRDPHEPDGAAPPPPSSP